MAIINAIRKHLPRQGMYTNYFIKSRMIKFKLNQLLLSSLVGLDFLLFSRPLRYLDFLRRRRLRRLQY